MQRLPTEFKAPQLRKKRKLELLSSFLPPFVDLVSLLLMLYSCCLTVFRFHSVDPLRRLPHRKRRCLTRGVRDPAPGQLEQELAPVQVAQERVRLQVAQERVRLQVAQERIHLQVRLTSHVLAFLVFSLASLFLFLLPSLPSPRLFFFFLFPFFLFFLYFPLYRLHRSWGNGCRSHGSYAGQ